MFYGFELGHNAMEATNDIYTKGQGTVGCSTVSRCFKKFHLCCKNFNNAWMLRDNPHLITGYYTSLFHF